MGFFHLSGFSQNLYCNLYNTMALRNFYKINNFADFIFLETYLYMGK